LEVYIHPAAGIAVLGADVEREWRDCDRRHGRNTSRCALSLLVRLDPK
jgi:hypothetical protein